MRYSIYMSSIIQHASPYTPLAIYGSIEQLDHNCTPSYIPEKFHSDYTTAIQFLLAYQNNAETFKSFRRDVERFTQWAWYFAQLSFAQLSAMDVEHYFLFCQNPPKNWIATGNVARFKMIDGQLQQNSAWRPFVARSTQKTTETKTKRYRLSEKGMREIFTGLNCFYNFLVQNDTVNKNPVKLVKQKNRFFRKVQGGAKIRRLSPLQWEFVVETAELMANENPDKHERTLFIILLLYGLYLRISELAANTTWEPTMNDFTQDHEENWWFKTIGKGNKEREIAVSDMVLAALVRWREHLDCTPALPLANDFQPLISGRSVHQAISSTRQIRRIVQSCFDRSVQRLCEDNFTHDAEALSQATTHWLRHTGISDDVKHRPREHVRDDAGHSSSLITDKYIDITRQERHHSAQKKLIKN